jgi:hypothetical protein
MIKISDGQIGPETIIIKKTELLKEDRKKSM